MNELLASVKEFEYLKKKLENRRLDYDAKQNKLNKCKKEKPSLEEEMRAAQYKYEETYSDMQNLMLRFGDKEVWIWYACTFAENIGNFGLVSNWVCANTSGVF